MRDRKSHRSLTDKARLNDIPRGNTVPVSRKDGPLANLAHRGDYGLTGGYKAGGHITAAQRRALPSSDFALPGKGSGPEGKGSGSYPIDTPARARSALSRGAADASPSEDARIKRRVHAKYPGMEIGGEKD